MLNFFFLAMKMKARTVVGKGERSLVRWLRI